MGKGELAMNFIHPTAYVDVMVKLGDNNYIGPFCHLTGELTVGDNNRFEGHCSVGTRPEHKDFWHKNGELKIYKLKCIIYNLCSKLYLIKMQGCLI